MDVLLVRRLDCLERDTKMLEFLQGLDQLDIKLYPLK